MAIEFYRYLSDPDEVRQVIEQRKIESRNPKGTWWTTYRFDDPVEAQEVLALASTPTHRVGPIDASRMPSFDETTLRPVASAQGQPGGGIEGRTTGVVWLFGVYDLSAQKYAL
jgi:hypothetical protein